MRNLFSITTRQSVNLLFVPRVASNGAAISFQRFDNPHIATVNQDVRGQAASASRNTSFPTSESLVLATESCLCEGARPNAVPFRSVRISCTLSPVRDTRTLRSACFPNQNQARQLTLADNAVALVSPEKALPLRPILCRERNAGALRATSFCRSAIELAIAIWRPPPCPLKSPQRLSCSVQLPCTERRGHCASWPSAASPLGSPSHFNSRRSHLLSLEERDRAVHLLVLSAMPRPVPLVVFAVAKSRLIVPYAVRHTMHFPLTPKKPGHHECPPAIWKHPSPACGNFDSRPTPRCLRHLQLIHLRSGSRSANRQHAPSPHASAAVHPRASLS